MMMVMMNDYESSQGDDINNWSAEDDGMVWDEDFDEDDDSSGSDVELKISYALFIMAIMTLNLTCT